MNGPFFRSYLNQQPSRPVPVQQTERRSSPKVVSVPVHFVSSEQPQTTISMLKESAALKIQRVFRGFLVRKSVKKIASIRNEVSGIERRINDVAVVDLIRRDAKERLKVNESLMSLLFKLDSIRGIDSGVRDLRKAVTKKAIALQEKVDSIAQADESTLDSANNDSGAIDPLEQVPEISDSPDVVLDHDHSRNLEVVEDDEEGAVKEVVKEIVEDCSPAKAADGKEDDASVNGSIEMQKEDGRDDDTKMNRELLEKLMDENNKMMKLMTQVLESNETQTRKINSLSRRVEQLEKTFTSTDKLRRKKKRHTSC